MEGFFLDSVKLTKNQHQNIWHFILISVDHSEEEEAEDQDKSLVDNSIGDDEETIRSNYRDKLSKMSMEDIQKLREKIGLKLFNKSFGNSKPKEKRVFKRENKNRPREMSSKKPVSRFRPAVSVVQQEKRDPRFDPLCGEFDDKSFKEDYRFVSDIKSGELKTLKKQLLEEEDPETRKKIKYLVQRFENQIRAERQKKEKEEVKQKEAKERKEMIKAGKKPYFVGKREQRENELVARYEKLKQSGGVDKYIKKKSKKNAAKDRKLKEKLS